MTRPTAAKAALVHHLFHSRNRLLAAIREQSLREPERRPISLLLQQCCAIIREAMHCDTVWAGDIDAEHRRLTLLASAPPSTDRDIAVGNRLAELLTKQFGSELTAFTEPLFLDFATDSSPRNPPARSHSIVWPIGFQDRTYGFVVVSGCGEVGLKGLKKEFLAHAIDDIALALYSCDTALKLQIERDFNKEIIDTIQALMVTIRPCGTIVSFNRRAEELTGFSEAEVLNKYWVDVLINPERRLEFQQVFSESLKGAQANINFTAPLRTKSLTERYISWHGSIRHNIEKGRVGLVMLGIDETETLAADQQLNMFTARWEKIFIAIQDPALVVSSDSIILEANPATFAAARKRREEVVGKKVCDILHDGHCEHGKCPLEQLIGRQKTRISETDLHGLHGPYMLTVSPLIEEDGDIHATLLVARNLTEEEVVRAEAIRAAQLAAIGELASGVAHEINNPINGIINYARIILDDPDDEGAKEHLTNIIGEGKRIAAIVSNLLDFARRKEERQAPSRVEKIIATSLQLVSHLLKKDGITCTVAIAETLPPLTCNEQQLQQVVLNIISNARYALNKRYPQPCPEKTLDITASLHRQNLREYIRLTFTDRGIGIAPDIRHRLFDPFFSTKPKGEGTGLGLSISHGLVREHGGSIRVQSKTGEGARFTIDLPLRPLQA